MVASLLALTLLAAPDGGLSMDVVAQLRRGAQQSQSDGIAVALDGELVLDQRWSKGPTRVQSVTKLFTGLAVGLLVADGKIPSYDAPLSTWFPEWRGTARGRLTLREVLEQTSGLGEVPRLRALDTANDAAAYAARTLQPWRTPGGEPEPSNGAVALLARVIRTSAGIPEDEFLNERLFKPLGITDWSWAHDASGNPHAWDGLALHASALAEVGAVLAAGGRWKGQQLVPASYLQAMQQDQHGLLAELIFDKREAVQLPESRKWLARLGARGTDKLAPLDGRGFPTLHAWRDAALPLLGPDDARSLENALAGRPPPLTMRGTHVLAIQALGAHGNTLIVFPGKQLAVARVRSSKEVDTFTLLLPLSVSLARER